MWAHHGAPTLRRRRRPAATARVEAAAALRFGWLRAGTVEAGRRSRAAAPDQNVKFTLRYAPRGAPGVMLLSLCAVGK